MTNDFDDLASAYLDGHATDDEAARVERDPELRAEVEALRQLSQQLGRPVLPPDALQGRRQIGVALDAFDELVAGPEASPASPRAETRPAEAAVVDLGRRRERRPSRGRAGLTPWLGVAAALLLVVGGVGLLSQLSLGGSDDESASDTAQVESTDDGEDASAAVAGDAARQAEDGEAMEEAELNESAASAEEATDAADEAAPSTTTAFSGDDGDDDAADGDVGATGARVRFDEFPSDEELAELAEERVEPDLSRCGIEYVPDRPELELDGYVPIDIGVEQAEVLYLVDPAVGDDDLVIVVVDDDCEPLG